MNGKLFLGLTLGLIGLASAGCSSTPGVVRAQSPAGPDGMMAAPMPGAPGAPVQGGVIVGTPDHPCPECGCTDGSCSHCRSGCDPHHRFWWHYIPPDKAQCAQDAAGCCCLGHCAGCLPDWAVCGDHGPLVYPPNPTPGAIVQYPYYTCKGPDDFFYQAPSPLGPSR